MLIYDVEMSRRVEATYTTADVVEQRRQLLDVLGAKPGETILDVGVGPGSRSPRWQRRERPQLPAAEPTVG